MTDANPLGNRDFEGSKLIRASADDVFAYISDVQNIPAYLAMVTEASLPEEDTIAVTIDLHGHEHSDTGTFDVDGPSRRMKWGSAGGDYQGWMEVADEGGDACLTMGLTWAAESPFPERMGEDEADTSPVDDAIEATLLSVKNIVEGRGGAVHPEDAEA